MAFPVASGAGGDAVAAMRALDIAGLSVTMPHKEAAAASADRLSPTATLLGSVNCLTNRSGVIEGDSTDGAGFLAALVEDLDFDPAGRRCVVLGAGGAARSVIVALAAAGASEVAVINRSVERAQVAAALAGDAGAVVGSDSIEGADLVVNATPVGMDGDSIPIVTSLLGPSTTVVDLIYHPASTPLLQRAAQIGCPTANGLSMLVHQAALQFELWTGMEAPLDVMRAAVRV